MFLLTRDHYRFEVSEPVAILLEGTVLGYGPALVLAFGAASTFVTGGDLRPAVFRLTFDLGLLFLSGVRRGLSFRSPQGPTMPQRVTFLWLFGLGFAALLLQRFTIAPAIVALGFASIGVCDWRAARKHEAPPYLARLRPPQMTKRRSACWRWRSLPVRSRLHEWGCSRSARPFQLLGSLDADPRQFRLCGFLGAHHVGIRRHALHCAAKRPNTCDASTGRRL